MTEPKDRFVVLRHQVGTGLERLNTEPSGADDHSDHEHFDWMFEVEGELRTWATPPIESFDDSFEVDAQRLPNHRIAYLEYEGEISDGRGQVKRVLKGHTQSADDDSQRFTAELTWTQAGQTHQASVAIYRSSPDVEPGVSWRLRFSRTRS